MHTWRTCERCAASLPTTYMHIIIHMNLWWHCEPQLWPKGLPDLLRPQAAVVCLLFVPTANGSQS